MKKFIKNKLTLTALKAVFCFPAGIIILFFGWSASGGHAATNNHLIINEILVGSTGEAKKEFIELYNPMDSSINLENYNLKKKTKSGTESNLVSSSKFIGTISPLSYFIITHTDHQGDFNADLIYSGTSYSISNNNTILLYDNNGDLVDKVGYGEASDYESTPVENPDTGVSIGRNDFVDTNNNGEDFIILDSVTPGKKNTGTSNDTSGEDDNTEEQDEEDNNIQTPIDPDIESFDLSQDIIFSEIFPNPIGLDKNNEWIEIYNRGKRTVNLYGWQLSDIDGVKYIFPKQTIRSKEYLLISKEESGISLNNIEDTIFIYQPFRDGWLQRVNYTKAPEGESYNYLDYKWIWNNNLTPGEKNKLEYKNTLPSVDFYFSEKLEAGIPILFDSSDTADRDKDDLKFFWNFNDGFFNTLKNPEHTFFNNGKFDVELSVFDGMGTTSISKTIIIGKERVEVLGWDGDYLVIINEIFPNPEGSDSQEFIELYNQGEEALNLFGWMLDDEDGGSKPYAFNKDTWIDPEDYLVIERKVSKIALNNNGDTVRLLKDEEVIDEVVYDNVVEANTYARGLNGKWFWTTEITPEEENFIEFSDDYKNDNFIFTPASTDSAQVQEIPFITITEVREQEVGSKVRVSGIVAVEPGVLALQYFYIVEQTGIQIYNYKKDFPNLKTGNIIEIEGVISMIGDEYRIKTKTRDDINILSESVELEPLEITCNEVNTDILGSLVTVSGEVIERKGYSVFLDDGSDEVKIYIKKFTGIDFKNIKSGDWLTVTGIISSTKSGFRILPRFKSDIEKQEIIVKSEENEVIGEVPAQEEWSIEGREKTEWYKYLLVIVGFIFVGVGIGYFKFKNK